MKTARNNQIALIIIISIIMAFCLGACKVVNVKEEKLPILRDTLVEYNYQENQVGGTDCILIDSTECGRNQRYLLQLDDKYYLTDSIYINSGAVVEYVSNDFKTIYTVTGITEQQIGYKKPDSQRNLEWTELKKVEEFKENKIIMSEIFDNDTKIFFDSEGIYYITDESSIFTIDDEVYVNPNSAINPKKMIKLEVKSDIIRVLDNEIISEGYIKLEFSDGKEIILDNISSEIKKAFEQGTTIFIV